MAVILAMVVMLWVMFVSEIAERVTRIDSVPELMKSAPTAFSGVLLIILGLELMAGLSLIGVTVLVMALAAGYFLVRFRTSAAPEPG